VAFYKALVRRGRVVASFAPRRDERGPVITVYRLPPPGVETAAAQHARA
jgi:hypothetical protein